MNHSRPPRDGRAYRSLWRLVEGAIADTINQHPDYFAEGRARAARLSIAKRVTGAILGFAEQSARGRSGVHAPAADTGRVSVVTPGRGGATPTSPQAGGAANVARHYRWERRPR
jgi:hypothetical protein